MEHTEKMVMVVGVQVRLHLYARDQIGLLCAPNYLIIIIWYTAEGPIVGLPSSGDHSRTCMILYAEGMV